MFIKELLISLIIAIILSAIFVLINRKKRPRTGFFWFFSIVLMATWAGGLWLKPFGPTFAGIQWFPFLTVGLFFAFLFSVFGPRRLPHGRDETIDKLQEIAREKELEKITFASLSVIFWIVFTALTIAVIIRYFL